MIDHRLTSDEGSARSAAAQAADSEFSATAAFDLARRHTAATNANGSRWRRLWSRTWLLAAWLASLSLLAIAALRILYHDGTYVLIWFNAFTSYVYLPAYAIVTWAAWKRRWPLTLVNVAIITCHLAWLAPDFLRDRRFDRPISPAAAEDVNEWPTMRIFFANVRENNEEYASMLREISQADPDVIVLVEYGWGWHLKFKTSPVLSPYKYGSGHLQSHIGSVNVFSRLPLKNELQSWIDGRPMHLVEVELGKQTLRLIGLHAPRPMNRPQYRYYKYWRQMAPLLLSQPGPLVIVGDFNATQHSRAIQQLTEKRLRSAHQDRGRGYATTWPNGDLFVPPIRIDHALLSPDVECLSIREGRGRGSDHKPLVLDVQIRPLPSAASRRVSDNFDYRGHSGRWSPADFVGVPHGPL